MKKIEGVFPAMVTPFSQDGMNVIYDAIPPHLEFLRQRGADGVLPLGTNGEFSSLSMEEKKKVVDVVAENREGLKLICGVNFTALPEAIDMGRYAEKKGADAVLIVPPYYFKNVPFDGLLAYYAAIFEAVRIPILLYNIPSFSGVEVTDTLLERLAGKYPHCAGVKDTSGSVERTARYCESFPRFSVFCGTDTLLAATMPLGATGCISALANVYPDVMKEIVNLSRTGKDATSRQKFINDAGDLAAKYPERATIKYLLHLKGLQMTYVRPPLRNLTEKEQVAFREAAQALNMI
jgi:4-hydroxy-tetrahydrodipicolinate synthase